VAWIDRGMISGFGRGSSSGASDAPSRLGGETGQTTLTLRTRRRRTARIDPGSGSETKLGPRRSSDPGLRWPPPLPRSAKAGQRLGSYYLIERLGQGRQADVWRALRMVPPVEEVALKVLSAAATAHDPRRRAQLRHEAERGTRMVDPALLPTYDFGEADGLLFLAMPLVVGCALGALLDQRRAFLAGKPLPSDSHPLAGLPEPRYTRTVAVLIAWVARAVAAAHAARVVHRDIKPMNILVRRDFAPDAAFAPHGDATIGRGSGPGVFLCDFGLGRDLDIATPCQLRDGAGSPLYMAPERLLKRPADEFRCDVYALGVTLFESLTLTPPVEVPPELPSTQWAAYLSAIEPRRAGAVRPDLSEAVEDVIHRAMHRDPARRHPTAAHFADDLEQAVEPLRV
jgi:eukaryotic-like serine/threonine-protein kinase